MPVGTGMDGVNSLLFSYPIFTIQKRIQPVFSSHHMICSWCSQGSMCDHSLMESLKSIYLMYLKNLFPKLIVPRNIFWVTYFPPQNSRETENYRLKTIYLFLICQRMAQVDQRTAYTPAAFAHPGTTDIPQNAWLLVLLSLKQNLPECTDLILIVMPVAWTLPPLKEHHL